MINDLLDNQNQNLVSLLSLSQKKKQLQNSLDNLVKFSQLIKEEKNKLSSVSAFQYFQMMEIQLNTQFKDSEQPDHHKLRQLTQDIFQNQKIKDCEILYQKTKEALSEHFTRIINESLELSYELDLIIKQESFYKFKKIQQIFRHTDQVLGLDICKQKNLLASGSVDKTVKLWNLENNTLIQTFLSTGTVFAVAFSPQGNLLAYSGQERIIRLIDISQIKIQYIVYHLCGHVGQIFKLMFSIDSTYLVSASGDFTLKIWNVQSKTQEFNFQTKKEVHAAAINSDNTLVASSTNDGLIKIWKVSNQKPLCTKMASKRGAAIQFSQKMIASSDYEGLVKLWSLQQLNSGRLILLKIFQVATKRISTVLFSPCLRFITSFCNIDRVIKVMDIQSNRVVKLFKSNSKNNCNHVELAISSEMDIIAYGENRNIIVWKSQ